MSLRAISKNELADWFLPQAAALTESLVRRSSLNRLRDFSQLATYIAGQPDFASRRTQMVDTLEQLDAESPDMLFRRLASPVFRGWLSGFGGVREYTETDPVLRMQLALWNNMRHSLVAPGDYRARMRVVNGCLHTFDPRVAVWVGDRAEVVVERVDDRLTITAIGAQSPMLDMDIAVELEESAERGPRGARLLSAARLPDSEIVIRNDLPLLRLQLSRTAQREDGVVFGAIDTSPESYPDFDPGPFSDAASILAAAWPEEYDDFRETLQVVVPRAAPDGWRARGMTVSSHQGAIWIFVRDVLDLIEHMVHEQSHVKLRYIEESCPILASRQTQERFSVGWRKDPRPIVGIYEGVYVHLHVLLAMARCSMHGCLSGDVADRCDARIGALGREIREGADLLAKHARFTRSGESFLEWATSCLASGLG